jgi:hypothetical protein
MVFLDSLHPEAGLSTTPTTALIPSWCGDGVVRLQVQPGETDPNSTSLTCSLGPLDKKIQLLTQPASKDVSIALAKLAGPWQDSKQSFPPLQKQI